MLIEAALFNLADRDALNRPIDWLDLTWLECTQRALRKATRGGRTVKILLRVSSTLKHGDVIMAESNSEPAVAVNVLPCELLVIKPRDATELAAVAFKLGDLHQPMQLVDGAVRAPADGPVEAGIAELGVPYEMQVGRFEPTHRSALPLISSDNLETGRLR